MNPFTTLSIQMECSPIFLILWWNAQLFSISLYFSPSLLLSSLNFPATKRQRWYTLLGALSLQSWYWSAPDRSQVSIRNPRLCSLVGIFIRCLQGIRVLGWHHVLHIHISGSVGMGSLGYREPISFWTMGSGTHCSKINGFPGTQGTHANGATKMRSLWAGKPHP